MNRRHIPVNCRSKIEGDLHTILKLLTTIVRAGTASLRRRRRRYAVLSAKRLPAVLHGANNVASHTIAMFARFIGSN